MLIIEDFTVTVKYNISIQAVFLFCNLFLKVKVVSPGAIQDFKLGGVLEKIAPSEGRRENFGVFRGLHRIINKKKLDIKKITTAYWLQKNVRSLPTK